MANTLTQSTVILDSLADGVYVCDRDRCIVYWSKSAERITGWLASEVLGKRCLDNVLCHIDKDGRELCGQEHCPLHRSMVTEAQSTCPIIVFAKGKNQQRIPMQVSVAPLCDDTGQVVGGVEIFRDMTTALGDYQRAQRIQALSMEHDLPADPRVHFSTIYAPHDYVGGDYYALRQLDPDHYGFMLADVMGHGIAAALHTMHLSSLWTRFHPLLVNPARFAATLNAELVRVVKDESFATGLCGVLDAAQHTLTLASAGGPPALLLRESNTIEPLDIPGTPFGLMDDAEYEQVTVNLKANEGFLLCTDGAFEIHNQNQEMLEMEGLIKLLQKYDYPRVPLPIKTLEEDLLRYSNAIRLLDDITFIEARFQA